MIMKQDPGGRLRATVVGDGQTDRAVMRFKVREMSRKHGCMWSHSVRPANHRAPHRDRPNRLSIESLETHTQEEHLTLHSSPASLLLFFSDYNSRSCIINIQNKTIIWGNLDLSVGMSHPF